MVTEFEKEKVFWTRKMNVKLVKFIEKRPNIWNPKHPKYTSTEFRDQTYNEFASKYGNKFTGQAVKERWTNIRSSFANYLRKVNASRQKLDGEEYNVNWHLWEHCQFLKKVNKSGRASTSKVAEGENVDDMLDIEENWSIYEENCVENNNTVNDSACNTIAKNLVELFKNIQNDTLGLDNTQNGKIGKIVSKRLSQLDSFSAAKASQNIMDILLLFDENNPMNPNNMMKGNDQDF